MAVRPATGTATPLVGELLAEFVAGVAGAWPPHEEEGGQAAEEEAFDPLGHVVSGGRAVVHVEDANGADDGEGDEHHGEHQVFTFRSTKTEEGRLRTEHIYTHKCLERTHPMTFTLLFLQFKRAAISACFM